MCARRKAVCHAALENIGKMMRRLKKQNIKDENLWSSVAAHPISSGHIKANLKRLDKPNLSPSFLRLL